MSYAHYLKTICCRGEHDAELSEHDAALLFGAMISLDTTTQARGWKLPFFNAVNLSFVAFGRAAGNVDGQIITFFVMTVAAAEAAVGLALDRVGFTVEDRDRAKGIYFVRYVDPDADNKSKQEKGFFSKLNPFSKTEKPVSKDQFQIQVKDASAVSEVSVLNKDGSEERSDTANRILTLLYEQLK